MKVSVATIALGKRWRHMMVQLETPEGARGGDVLEVAAAQESARTTPTSATQEKSRRMPSSSQKLGARTLEMINSR